MSIKHDTISGLKWTTISTVTQTIVNIIKISVLARFLEKSDFGIMAVVTFVLGFMALFMDMGLSTAIMHKQNISQLEYASMYWINVVFSILLFLFIWMISPWVAEYYTESDLNSLIPLMGISIILSAIGQQYRTIEQKELNFKLISLVDIITSSAGLIVSVVLAIYGYGVYSLVLGSLTMYTISNIFYFTNGIFKRGFVLHFSYAEAKPFLKIGLYQVGGQVVNYFNRDVDILIIGKIFGSEMLGGYSLAKQLVRRPLQLIDAVIIKVGISIFPLYQDNNKYLRRYTSRVLQLLGTANGVIYGLIAILATPLVRVIYGADYLNISTFVQLFAGLIFLRSMSGLVGIIVITKGRTDLDFYWNIVTIFVYPIAIFAGSFMSLEIIILLMFGVQFFLLIPGWIVFYKNLIHLDIKTYLRPILIPLFLAIIFATFAQQFENSIIKLLCSILLCLSMFAYLYLISVEVRLYLKGKMKDYARI